MTELLQDDVAFKSQYKRIVVKRIWTEETLEIIMQSRLISRLLLIQDLKNGINILNQILESPNYDS